MATTTRARIMRSMIAVVVTLCVSLGFTVTTATPASALTYAENAWWSNGPYGQTLHITPSGIAQAIGISAASGVWNNALHIAGTPPYSSRVYNSLFEQLQCHLIVRFKTPYNLDTWRPSVSWAAEIRDKCNPLPGERD